jgi:protein-tyrosine-phosphatase
MVAMAADRQLFGAPSRLPIEDPLRAYVENRTAEYGTISKDRRTQLEKVAHYVRERTVAGRPARLTFICTHNSRRSQMAQVWAALAAAWYGIEPVETFSGGTEETAFNPRAVAALERAGFLIEKGTETTNPRYLVRFDKGKPLICFSKVYEAAPNPSSDYCAVMTCSQADKACPLVKGAALRVAVAFDDPKAADGTSGVSAAYDERCAQIASEMLYLFSQVTALPANAFP